jgi:AraC-like DNA-binding protein
MLRLRKEDFDDPHDVAKLAAIAHCSIAEFRERFSYVTADEPPAVITEMASNVR